jgi:hypothetical protein
MTHIDKDGMDIEILGQKDKTVVRVPFDPPLKYYSSLFVNGHEYS